MSGTWINYGIRLTRILIKSVLRWYVTWFITNNEFN